MSTNPPAEPSTVVTTNEALKVVKDQVTLLVRIARDSSDVLEEAVAELGFDKRHPQLWSTNCTFDQALKFIQSTQLCPESYLLLGKDRVPIPVGLTKARYVISLDSTEFHVPADVSHILEFADGRTLI